MPKPTTDALILQWIADDPDSFRTRVLDRLVPQGGHMVWTMALSSHSAPGPYGVVGIPWKYATNRQCGVHRAIWLYHHGSIPDGMVVDHDASGCCTRHCAKIEHLSLEIDGVSGAKHRTHCLNCGEERQVYGGVMRCRSCRLRTNRASTAR